jgi:hypothetical protein
MLKGGYSLPFQRIKGADVDGNMGNPKGPCVPIDRGRVCFDLTTARSIPQTFNSELLFIQISFL